MKIPTLLPIVMLLLALALLPAACVPFNIFNATGTPLPPTNTPTLPPTASPTATITPTATAEAPIGGPSCPPASPAVAGWPVYCNDHYEFYFQYPPEAVISQEDQNMVRLELPIQPDTNLGEKYLEVVVQETTGACESPLASGYPPEMVQQQQVVLAGTAFLKQQGADAGAGNIWQWTAYSTGRAGVCVYFNFVLHSTNPYNYPTPPPEFDEDTETAVYEQIVGSFAWYTR